jgi:arsenate reductase
MSMYPTLSETIQQLEWEKINNDERKSTLQPLIDFIQLKINSKQQININFICTHNSRRSHLSQVWAQVAASHFGIENVIC